MKLLQRIIIMQQLYQFNILFLPIVMKKILIFLLTLLPLTAFSQEEGILIDSTITYQYTSPTDSVFLSKGYYERNYSGQLLLANYFQWDSNLNEWIWTKKEERSYDEDGHTVFGANYNWDSGLNDWVGVEKGEWGYDENENQILKAKYNWDFGQSNWVGVEKDMYEYDENNQELWHIYFNWDVGLNDWIEVAKNETVFDSEGNKAYSQIYTWDSNSNEWVFNSNDANFNKDESENDENGNQIWFTRYYWSFSLNDWAAQYIYERTFDANNNKLSEVYSLFDYMNNPIVLILSDSISFSYDSEGNLILTKDITGDINTSEWYYAGETQYQNTYDSNGNLILVLTPNVSKQEREYDVENNLIRQEIYRWEGSINDWVLEIIEEYNPQVAGYNVTLREQYRWNSIAGLYLFGKTQRQFDSDGEVIIYQINENYWWDSFNEILIGISKTEREREFNSEGNLLMSAYYEWDNNINDWYGTNKSVRRIDSYGNVFLTFRYAWDSNLSDWVLDKKDYSYYGGFLFDTEDSICEGESIQWQGQYLTLSDTYVENFTSIWGRDSTYQFTLTVNPRPSSFVITGETTTTTNETLVYLAPDNNTLTYSWSVDNGSILSNPLYNSVEIQWGGMGEGMIYGFATNEYGCKSDTVELQVAIGTTGVNDLLGNGIRLYPNPVKDILNISSVDENIEVEILSMSGTKLLSAKSYSIDLSSLPTGTYIVRVKAGNGNMIGIRKIIKK